MYRQYTTYIETIKYHTNANIALIGNQESIQLALNIIHEVKLPVMKPIVIFPTEEMNLNEYQLNIKIEPISNIDKVMMDVLIVSDLQLNKAVGVYFSLTSILDKGIPVVFGFTRGLYFRHITAAPTGIWYSGMFHLLADYIKSTKSQGDYAEFGVFDGQSFSFAYQGLKEVVNINRFLAFDTFKGIRNSCDNELQNFTDGQYYANLETFLLNMRMIGMDFERLKVIQGDFQDSLNEETAEKHEINTILIANIDCDVYQPAKKALDFLTNKIISGGVILFDDFDQMGANNNKGERRAFNEWLEENKHISAELYRTFGVFGRSFIIHK